jgi:cytochrome c oxidase subunit 3
MLDMGEEHFPVGEDLPEGLSEASWWPFITASGAVGLYIGAGLFMLARGFVEMIPLFVGPVVLLMSVALFFVGLLGWLYDGFVADFWAGDTEDRQPESHRWGMILFIVTDIATFAAGFVYYFYIRAWTWPPAELPGLVSSILLVNTAVLFSSSVTIHFAEQALKEGNRQRFIGLLATTVGLGALFVSGQVYEYYEFVVKEGFTISTGVFGGAFYGLTGLHGMHVALGTILLCILLVRALLGQYSADRHSSVSTISWYWHFIDGVWFTLVTVVYVSSSVTTIF